MNTAALADTLSRLPQLGQPVFIGLDGFVDRLLRVVEKRFDAERCSYVQTLADYGRMVNAAAGLSLNVELICERSQLGGNGPIMANAFTALGAKVSCLGAFGLPELAPEFSELAGKCALYSVSEPAHTDSWEFEDGKIIASQLQPLNSFGWETLLQHCPEETLLRLLEGSQLIALNNWTMIPAMTEIWRRILQLLPKLSDADRLFFFDLADPYKRSRQDLREALELLGSFSAYGRVLLSCNKRELLQIAAVFCPAASETAKLTVTAEAIRNALGIWAVSVHTLYNACAAYEGGVAEGEGFYTPKPLLSIGGGDHFNAGLAWALLSGLGWDEALAVGSAVSGCFVRSGHSPSCEDLILFLRQWMTSFQAESTATG